MICAAARPTFPRRDPAAGRRSAIIAATIGFFLGALLVTFLLTRLFLWLSAGWPGGMLRLAAIHVASLLILSIASGVSSADGAGFRTSTLLSYLAAQAIWFAFDWFRLLRAEKKAVG